MSYTAMTQHSPARLQSAVLLLQGRQGGQGQQHQDTHLELPFPMLLFRWPLFSVHAASVPLVIQGKAFLMSFLFVPSFPFIFGERVAFFFGVLLSLFPGAAFLRMPLSSIRLFVPPVSPFTLLFVKPVIKGVVLAVTVLQL